jgi:hypothetical protein
MRQWRIGENAAANGHGTTQRTFRFAGGLCIFQTGRPARDAGGMWNNPPEQAFQ